MSAAPAVSVRDVQRLVKVLEAAPDWLSAEALANALFGKTTETAKRKVRSIANAAGDAVFSYPGSPGYRLWERCTVEEIRHGLDAWDAQIRDMRLRSVHFRRRYFRAHPATIKPDPELRPSQEQGQLF
jgi:hypothetical protein